MTTVFISYSHKDEALRNELEVHLMMLKREGAIDLWHDRRILAGDELDGAIGSKLESADVILLLISPDFLASSYCYDVEVKRAMERHEARSARVIPVILRPCDWQSSTAPFRKLLAVPRDGRAISRWPDRDEAFLDVVAQIRAALPACNREVPQRDNTLASSSPVVDTPRSSNLRLRKTFSEADRDRFLDKAFDFMARFFEKSLDELQSRNPGIESRFRRIDGNSLGCVIYRDGKAVARCGVRRGSRQGFGSGITYSQNEVPSEGSYNESLNVEADDQSLYLKAMGMPMHRSVSRENKLTLEGAAEYYWSLLIERLQR